MKTFLFLVLGLIIGGLISFSFVAKAKEPYLSNGVSAVRWAEVGYLGIVWKITEGDTTCYAFKAGYAGGISCLK